MALLTVPETMNEGPAPPEVGSTVKKEELSTEEEPQATETHSVPFPVCTPVIGTLGPEGPPSVALDPETLQRNDELVVRFSTPPVIERQRTDTWKVVLPPRKMTAEEGRNATTRLPMQEGGGEPPLPPTVTLAARCPESPLRFAVAVTEADPFATAVDRVVGPEAGVTVTAVPETDQEIDALEVTFSEPDIPPQSTSARNGWRAPTTKAAEEGVTRTMSPMHELSGLAAGAAARIADAGAADAREATSDNDSAIESARTATPGVAEFPSLLEGVMGRWANL